MGGHHNGPHWPAGSQAHGSPADQPDISDEGTPADLATIKAQLDAQLSYLQSQALAQQAVGANYAQQIAGNVFYGGVSVSTWSSTAPVNLPAPLKLPTIITAGEIIAWRCWRVADGWLRSVYMDTFWGPHEPMEGNVNTDGVHAWKKMSDAITYGLIGGVHGAGARVVIGTVAMWGEVIEHEIGYRAQFAKIKSLDHSADKSIGEEELRELRRKYLA